MLQSTRSQRAGHNLVTEKQHFYSVLLVLQFHCYVSRCGFSFRYPSGFVHLPKMRMGQSVLRHLHLWCLCCLSPMSFLSAIYQGKCHMVTLSLNFQEAPDCVHKELHFLLSYQQSVGSQRVRHDWVTNTHPHQQSITIRFSLSSATPVIIYLFVYNCYTRYELMSHLHLPNLRDGEHLYMCLLVISVSHFGKYLFRSFSHIFF